MPQVRHRRPTLPVWVALAALLLVIAAGLWLALYPGFYQGASVTASSSGEAAPRIEQASLVAENGISVLGLLAVPVVLAGLGLFGTIKGRRVLLWSVAAALLAFSVLSAMTIGVFYLPAAMALLVAAAQSNSPRTPGRV